MKPQAPVGTPQLIAALICTQAELISPGVYDLRAANEMTVTRPGEDEDFTVVRVALFIKLLAGTFEYLDPVEVFHCNPWDERERVTHEGAELTRDGTSLDAIIWFSRRFPNGGHSFEVVVSGHVVAKVPLRVFYPDELSPAELELRHIPSDEAVS